MATLVSMTEARRYFEQLCERAEKGEIITLTRHGKPVADLTRHGSQETSPDSGSKRISSP